MNTTINILLYVLMGFFAFSPFGSDIALRILKLPISIPEVFFIPFLFLLRKDLNKSFLFSTKIFFKLSYALIILLCLSIILEIYPLYNILGTFRVYLYLILMVSFSVLKRPFEMENLIYISIGSLLGWILSSLFAISQFNNNNIDAIAVTGNMLSIPVAILATLLCRNYKLFMLVMILCTILSFMSGMRRQIILIILSICIYIFFIKRKYLKKFLLIFSAFVTILFLILDRIALYLESEFPILHYRIFQKTEALIEGNSNEGDERRFDNFIYLVNHLDEYLIPHGFVSRDTLNHSVGIFIDFPLLELCYTLSFIGTIVLLLWLISLLYKNFKYFSISNDIYSKISFFIVLIMFVLLFLEGTFLSSSYTVPFTGYFLGQLYYYSKLKNHEKAI